MDDDPHDLARFVDAQQGVHEQALAEIRSGRKRSHWMWFVFPQLAGLGSSAISQRYGITGGAEAAAYLRHPVLGPRLAACAEAALSLPETTAHEIFGSPDDMKLRSSATLFAAVSPTGSVFHRLLDRYFQGAPDPRTIALLPTAPEAAAPHARRPRYAGRNPRAFHEKYKELDPARYPADVEKVLASGKTPAGTHRPIMVQEVLECLRPSPGELAVDCTLGGGGHARAILARVQPGGRVIGLDVDPLELPRTEAALRAEGFGPETFTAHRVSFAALPKVLGTERPADMILADLGVSSMQLDNPDRGFNYKEPGPLDMRMNPSRGQPASELIARLGEQDLAALLDDNADEPHAALIARLLKQQPLATTQALERTVRVGLTATHGGLAKTDVKMSVRRTFQALRIAVNNEFSALEALLRSLPHCLAPGGRVAILTFHSGEDRRVKKAFQAGVREGLFSAIATEVVRSTMEETRANRRASSAKLRWAVRGI